MKKLNWDFVDQEILSCKYFDKIIKDECFQEIKDNVWCYFKINLREALDII